MNDTFSPDGTAAGDTAGDTAGDKTGDATGDTAGDTTGDAAVDGTRLVAMVMIKRSGIMFDWVSFMVSNSNNLQ